ncbi:MAG: helix-turn-helix domain-containing protein [Bacteroidota bacterium]
MLNIWEIIFLFFAFQALLLSIFFFLRKGNRVSNVLLGTYLLLFSINITYNVLYWSKLLFTETYVHLFGILTHLWILYPPMIYLYTRSVVTGQKFRLFDLVHAIPLILSVALYAPFYVLSASEKINVLSTWTLPNYVFKVQYFFIGVIVLLLLYIVLTYTSFNKKEMSRNKRIWLSWLVGAFACYAAAMISYFVLSRLGLIEKEHDYFMTYIIIFCVGLVSYFGFVQPDVFDGLSMQKVLPFTKYKNTGLTKAYSQEIKAQLLHYMEEQKPYLESTLRLDDLSNELGVSRHHASQVINEHFDTNFFDFINGYRIEESKRLLRADMDRSISDIIYASGFNNRVSFYKTFKKHTGLTPSQYRDQSASL